MVTTKIREGEGASPGDAERSAPKPSCLPRQATEPLAPSRWILV